MPKGVEIEDFAAKLDLVCKQLNWSRAKLAQQVGIDKSLAGRWLLGASRPTGNTLMRLNQTLALALPEFTSSCWDLSTEELAARLGVEQAKALPSGKAGNGAAPQGVGSILAGLRTFVRAREGIDVLAGIYCGFYRFWFGSFNNDGSILRRPAWLWREGGAIRFRVGGNTAIYEGECVPTLRGLYLIGETGAFDSMILMQLVGGHARHPNRLSGLIVYQPQGRPEVSVAGTPTVFEFIGPPSSDRAANERTWTQMLSAESAVLVDDKEARGQLPKAVLQMLRPTVGVRRGEKSVDHILTVRLVD
ncbi:MAG: helix-turn-helix transcriptional regulator [Alphaproteobacteria bacterium]|nr:helix-turn-helix transcriptional regulator [Alphaproteobacteria bacterium]MBV8406838.1 helix-turn-helix transcriptional regulator [Alphaproteobacteria bacterium]